eukprot:2019054-Heterocapsa_arctica.AAC.1
MQNQSLGTAARKGDFGFKVLTSSDPVAKTAKLAAEIAGGYLAMMAIIRCSSNRKVRCRDRRWLLGHDGDHWLGVQAPIGFWGPAQRAGVGWLLGPGGLRCGWQLRELGVPLLDVLGRIAMLAYT